MSVRSKSLDIPKYAINYFCIKMFKFSILLWPLKTLFC